MRDPNAMADRLSIGPRAASAIAPLQNEPRPLHNRNPAPETFRAPFASRSATPAPDPSRLKQLIRPAPGHHSVAPGTFTRLSPAVPAGRARPGPDSLATMQPR